MPVQQLKLILIYPGLLTAPQCWVGILPINGTLPNPSLATVPPGCPLPPRWLATFCRKRNPSPCPFGWEACPPAHISPLCDAQPQHHTSWWRQLHHHEPPRFLQSPKQCGGWGERGPVRSEELQKRLGWRGGMCCTTTRFSMRTQRIAWGARAERRRRRRRRSGKVRENQTREALQTKHFISQPGISAEPGDFSEGKGRYSPPQG